jgi:5-hydroxyisourate hydrolase
MGRLSTHVLDTSNGIPAAGMRIELYRAPGAGPGTPLRSVAANGDGRTESPLLEGEDFVQGSYSLVFHVGEYFRVHGHPDAGRFLENVTVSFLVDDASAKYHVPLLVSPWSYSTYRGS